MGNVIQNLEIENKIISYVKSSFKCSAHDFQHVIRVKNLAIQIKENIDVDMDILIPSIYLHDIARASVDELKNKNICHALRGSIIARKFLIQIEYDNNKIDSICHCIESHNSRSRINPETIEAKILFDADKIDGLGAVGIARLFAMSGKYGTSIYEEEIDLDSKEFVAPNVEFKKKHKSILEKLYLERSIEIAKERLQFMKEFFNTMDDEIKLFQIN